MPEAARIFNTGCVIVRRNPNALAIKILGF
jgi:hypothetical protein